MSNNFKDIAIDVANTFVDNSLSALALSFTGVLKPNFWFVGSFRHLLLHSLNHEKMYAQIEKQNIQQMYLKNLML